ncbi:MAG: DUF445 family protein [Balneolaceae bacterium]|nr:DUF445 family protein [Balneolaceae bacterium]MBO6546282.1 DUF445 family protein [Balneolaceae bacterium]MBO6648641.1 DUF445 family protein [Balneolaceae bacterium]
MKEIEEKNIITENSKRYASQLWGLITTQIEKQTADLQPTNTRPAPPRSEAKYKWLINLLFIFPLFLLIGFTLSFFWDFNGLSASVLGLTISFEGLLRILSISGMIGFLTNWLAIKMLFRPTKKRPILGQGLIPAQKERIAYRLAVAVSEDLINPEIIKKKIHESQAITKYREKATDYIKAIIDDPEFRLELKKLVVSYVDEMVADPEIRGTLAKTVIEQIEGAIEQNSFERVALKAYSFLKGQEMQDLVEEALNKVPGGVEKGLDKMDTFLDDLPNRIDKHSSTIEDIVTSLLYKLINQLDVHSLVEDNLRQYDEKRLEIMIKNASNDQLRYIQYLGAVLGTLGGFVIWQPLASLAVLGFIILITLGLDSLLVKMKTS